VGWVGGWWVGNGILGRGGVVERGTLYIIKYDGVAGLGREEVGGFFGWDDGGVGNRYG
jgi:hypothetical protein